MRPFLVIPFDVLCTIVPGHLGAVISLQVNTFVFDRPPQPLHKDIVPPSAFAIHGYLTALSLHGVNKVLVRELAAITYAYYSCKANKGAAGVDGIRFENIESYGEERWLGELATRLRMKDNQPEAVRRVMIPKPTGKLRLCWC